MSSPISPNRPRSSSWQERLQDHCRNAQLTPPVFNIVSDRRGGRTAWSSTVTIPTPSSPTSQTASSSAGRQTTIQARYWYDGQYVHNAKEDAAEVALRTLMGGALGSGGGSGGGSAGGFGAGGSGAGGGAGAGASSGWGRGAAVPSGGAWPRSPPSGPWGR